MNLPKENSWKDKISHTSQLGGIETSILDNGLAKGTRIAWFNTGTGLRFKVVLDRGMDIVDTFYNQHSLAWISHNGISAPQPFSDQGIDWLKTFSGGLLTTCGLSNIGGPNEDEHGQRGLHGRISNISAEIESIIQPDPLIGQMQMSITGILKESTVFGANLELRRTISCTLGELTIRINDEIINRGNAKVPVMVLYHVNLGYPLVDEGSQIIWKGGWKARDKKSEEIFAKTNDFKTCPPPLIEHKGTGEAAAFIEMDSDENGFCNCGIRNEKIGLNVNLKYKKDQLPAFCNWQHWGKGEYVTGLEPGTNLPIGQKQAREDETLQFLQPFETKKIDLEFNISTI
jgi:hypothetical protein